MTAATRSPPRGPLSRARKAFERQDYDACARLCRLALVKEPKAHAAQRLLGMAAVKLRLADAALGALQDAVQHDARDAEVRVYLAAALLMDNRPAEALASADRALALEPGNPLSMNLRACALGALGRHQDSLRACDLALVSKPDYAEALVNRGNALVALGRLEDALDSFAQARHLQPTLVAALNNAANTLKQLHRYSEAVQWYDAALALAPTYADAAFNRGVALSEMGRPRFAQRSYLRALAADPGHVDARFNLAHSRLQTGDYARGWQDYEVRQQWARHTTAAPLRGQVPWLGGKPLAGKTILLHAEAGLGDTIQFCRYVDMVAARGARVILEVQPQLLALLRNLRGATWVVPQGKRLPSFDHHCPLMSLPLAFGTELATVPARVPYIVSDNRCVTRWARRIGPSRGARPKVGVTWRGNAAHGNDRNRSLSLSQLLPLLDVDCVWVSLQKDLREDDAAVLDRHPEILRFEQQLVDFADTAALIEHLDLVVTVDTSVAHLAGAMGKPVWVLLPFNADWRWLRKRVDSPWYPTARLFRQPAAGDWRHVVASVSRALRRQYN